MCPSSLFFELENREMNHEKSMVEVRFRRNCNDALQHSAIPKPMSDPFYLLYICMKFLHRLLWKESLFFSLDSTYNVHFSMFYLKISFHYNAHNIHLYYIPFFHARGISVLNKETNCNWCHKNLKNMLKIETKVIYLIFLGGDSVSAFWSCLLDCTSLRDKILIISKDWWNIY